MTTSADSERIATLEKTVSDLTGLLSGLMKELGYVQRSVNALNEFAVDLDHRLTSARVLERGADPTAQPIADDAYHLHVEPVTPFPAD